MAMALKRNLFIVFIVVRRDINNRGFTMGKKQITIEEYRNTSKSHTITVYNARCQKGFYSDIEKMLKDFFKSEELFFGFYRTDGLNITSKKTEDLKEEIRQIYHNLLPPELLYGVKTRKNCMSEPVTELQK